MRRCLCKQLCPHLFLTCFCMYALILSAACPRSASSTSKRIDGLLPRPKHASPPVDCSFICAAVSIALVRKFSPAVFVTSAPQIGFESLFSLNCQRLEYSRKTPHSVKVHSTGILSLQRILRIRHQKNCEGNLLSDRIILSEFRKGGSFQRYFTVMLRELSVLQFDSSDFEQIPVRRTYVCDRDAAFDTA